MNQRESKQQGYEIPTSVSQETRAALERAQERLRLFAARPEERRAYELEVLSLIDQNTQLEDLFTQGLERSREEGREEGLEKGRIKTLKLSIEGMRSAGMDDELIASSLKLSSEEREALLAPR